MKPFLFLLALPAGLLQAGEGSLRYDLFPFEWTGAVENLLPIDIDGDRLKDLVRAGDLTLDFYFQRKDGGFSLEKPGVTLRIPGRAVGWCIAPLVRGGPPLVAALRDGREAMMWSFDPSRRAFSEPATLRDGLPGDLPGGFHHLPFLRDLNGDGLADLVIPGTRRFHVFLAKGEGAFAEEFGVPVEVEVHSKLSGGEDLSERIGQSVTFPVLALRDLNGDGREDLLSETKDRVEGWLAGPDSAFPSAPAFVFDLAAVRAQLGPNDLESLDYSNLTASLAKTVQMVFGDVDGDRIEDAVLRAGGKVSLFLGRPEGIDPRKSDQVLKSSGNVIFATLDDEDGDGRADLWLVRIEAVSMGDLFLWLIASGKIDFDVFVYRNSGGRFSSRPSRRITLAVRFASLVSLLDQAKQLSSKESSGTVARAGDLTGRGVRCDLMVIEGGRLQAYLDRALRPPAAPIRKENFLRSILELSGYSREKDEYDVDLTNLPDFISRFEKGQPGKPEGLKPDFEVPLAGAPATPGASLLDLNGDRRDDLILIYEWTGRKLKGAVLLSRAE